MTPHVQMPMSTRSVYLDPPGEIAHVVGVTQCVIMGIGVWCGCHEILIERLSLTVVVVVVVVVVEIKRERAKSSALMPKGVSHYVCALRSAFGLSRCWLEGVAPCTLHPVFSYNKQC